MTTLGSVSVDITANIQGFEAGVRKVTANLKDLQAATTRNATQQAKVYDSTTLALARQTKQIATARERLLNLQQAVQNSTMSQQQQARVIADLNAQFQKYTATVKNATGDSLKQAQAQTQLTARFNQTRRNLSQLASDQKVADRATAEAAKGMALFSEKLQNAASVAILSEGPLGQVAARITAFSAVAKAGALGLVTVGLAVVGLGSAIKKAVVEAEGFDKEMRTYNAVLHATGQASGQTAEQIDAMANAIANNTGATVESISAASVKLLSFKSVAGDAFQRTLELAQDLAATGFGSVEQSTVTLAKALEDPIRGMAALRRVGVSFAEEQERVIKALVRTGQVAEAQGKILDIVAGQVGGAGAAQGAGLAGAYNRLTIATDNWFESLGKTGPIQTMIGWMKSLADGAADLTGKLEQAMFGRDLDQSFADTSDSVKRLTEELKNLEGTWDRLFNRPIAERFLSNARRELQDLTADIVERDEGRDTAAIRSAGAQKRLSEEKQAGTDRPFKLQTDTMRDQVRLQALQNENFGAQQKDLTRIVALEQLRADLAAMEAKDGSKISAQYVAARVKAIDALSAQQELNRTLLAQEEGRVTAARMLADLQARQAEVAALATGGEGAVRQVAIHADVSRQLAEIGERFKNNKDAQAAYEAQIIASAQNINPAINSITEALTTLGMRMDATAQKEFGTRILQDLQAQNSLLQVEQSMLLASNAERQAAVEMESILLTLKRQGIELAPAQMAAIEQQVEANARLNDALQRQQQVVNQTKQITSQFLFDAVRGTNDWKEALNVFINRLIDMMLQLLIIQPIIDGIAASINNMNTGGGGGGGGGGIWGTIAKIGFSAAGMMFGGGAGVTAAGAQAMGSVAPMASAGIGFAKGGVFNFGQLKAFANGGIVGSPTTFPMAGGNMGLMGEKGPEAVMPLVRGKGGRLGVAASGQEREPGFSSTPPQITIVDAKGDKEIVRLVRRAIMQAAPQLVSAAVALVRDERKRNPER